MPDGPEGSTYIVDELLTLEQLQDEDVWCFSTLMEVTTDIESVLEFCASHHLIRNTMTCESCLSPCTLQRYNSEIDGFLWVCASCVFQKSVREKSLFSQSRLPIRKILILMYMWCCGDSQTQMLCEVRDENKNVIVKWCNLIRSECTTWLDNNFEGIGGTDNSGEAVLVEIDELEFCPTNSQQEAKHLVFGGVEIERGKCFLVEVPDRTAETLERCLTQNIKPGTHIISDGSTALNNIELVNRGLYQHSIVVRRDNSGQSRDSFDHKQNLKNMWLAARRKLNRQYGRGSVPLSSYLREFMFRNVFSNDDVFKQFIIILKANYE